MAHVHSAGPGPIIGGVVGAVVVAILIVVVVILLVVAIVMNKRKQGRTNFLIVNNVTLLGFKESGAMSRYAYNVINHDIIDILKSSVEIL